MSYHYLGREWEQHEELETRAQDNDQPNRNRSLRSSTSERMGIEDDGFITGHGLN